MDECESDFEECYACGEVLGARSEKHHFPVPRRHHGTVTVKLCMNCHDWIDRTPLKKWPLDMWLEGFSQMNKCGKLAMLKIASLASDAAAEESEHNASLVS